MKFKQGYRYEEGSSNQDIVGKFEQVNEGDFWRPAGSVLAGDESQNTYAFNVTMKKRSMYFRAYAKMVNYENKSDKSYCTWEIETGDHKRLGGSKASKFEF